MTLSIHNKWCAMYLFHSFSCDIDEPGVWRLDEGRFTDKTSLPVSELYLGDTGDAGEQAEWWLGPLVCATPGLAVSICLRD